MITTKEFFRVIVSKFYNQNQAQAADDLGIKPSSMSNYMNGSSEAKFSTILRVFDKFKNELNPEWVLGQTAIVDRIDNNAELKRLREKNHEMKEDIKSLSQLIKKYVR